MTGNHTIISLQEISRTNSKALEAGHLMLFRNSMYKHFREHPDMKGYAPYSPYISLEYSRNDVITLLSRHSTGKSITAKRIVDLSLHYEELKRIRRPIVVFDMQGVDWRLMQYKSKGGFIFSEYGEERHGWGERVICLTPEYLVKESKFVASVYGDDTFKIDWREMTLREWAFAISLQTDSSSWADNFLSIIRDHKEDIESLPWFMEQIKDALRNLKDHSVWNPIIPEWLTMGELMKINNFLHNFIGSGAFDDDASTDIDEDWLIKLLDKQRIVVLNFHSDESWITKIYTGIIFRQIYRYYEKKAAEKYPRLINAPFMIIEESDKLSPDRRSGSESPGEFWIKEIINKGMKYGFKIMLLLQNAHNLGTKLRQIIFDNTLLTCSMNYADLELFTKYYGRDMKKIIQSLDTNRDKFGATEWALIQNKKIYTGWPAVSLSEFHKR